MPASRSLISSSLTRSTVVGTESFNQSRQTRARGSNAPYPTAQSVWMRSSNHESADPFEDLYLRDMVRARKRVARHRLHHLQTRPALSALLDRGIQRNMEVEDEPNDTVEIAIGYAGAIGVELVNELAEAYEFVSGSSVDLIP